METNRSELYAGWLNRPTVSSVSNQFVGGGRAEEQRVLIRHQQGAAKAHVPLWVVQKNLTFDQIWTALILSRMLGFYFKASVTSLQIQIFYIKYKSTKKSSRMMELPGSTREIKSHVRVTKYVHFVHKTPTIRPSLSYFILLINIIFMTWKQDE